MKRSFEMDEDSTTLDGFGSDCSSTCGGGGEASIKRFAYSRISAADEEVKRQPTRRPDPKVTNRNALMARENRRKQKERMEHLEMENQALSDKNIDLQRALKAKDKLIHELRKEQMYLKSVITNKTPIIRILNTIKESQLPMTSSLNNFMATRGEKSPATESTSSGYASPNLNLQKHGTVDDWLVDLTASPIDQNLTFTDYEMDTNRLATDLWNDLGVTNDILSDLQPKQEDEDSSHVYDLADQELVLPSAGGDHSYSEVVDPGLCVHISNQRVSVEFCGSCHANAADGWLEH